MAPSNAALLTRQSKAWAHKKRARQGQVKEVVFDEEARRDYLTGFQKRNAEKKKVAKAKAVEREKAEHLEERRQMRKDLKERARTNFEAVEKAYGGAALSILDKPLTAPANEHEDEYSDDEQLATVAVIEDFDPTADMHGPREQNGDESKGERTTPTEAKGKSKAGRTLSKTSVKLAQRKDTRSPARKIRDINHTLDANRRNKLDAMAAHRRTTSDSNPNVAVFVPHPLSFAGAGDDDDKYFAALRYDWDDVPAKLTQPRAPYEPTQPFDYVLPKKVRGKALAASNANGREDADSAPGYELLKKRMGRPRRENQSPAVSVEPDGGEKSAPKRRGRPPRRMVETGRKTDDGDNSEDESYVQPSESWKAGMKRRGSAPQNPPKRARISRTVDTDEEQEDRQLIDSLFEVLGSIPWRRVTAYMADKGFSCADRGEGAIRGRWKVLRPRLYIAPPPVVRGAAAKSQHKAREREENVARDEEDEEMEVDPKEPEPEQEHEAPPEPEQVVIDVDTVGGRDMEAMGGDTTAEDDDVAVREADAKKRERAQRRRVPPTPDAPSPEAHAGEESGGPLVAQNPTDLHVPPSQPRAVSPGPPTPPSIPAPVLAPGQTSTPYLSALALPPHSPPPSFTTSLAFVSLSQPFQHSIPNVSREPKEPRAYSHYPPTSRLEEHPGHRPMSPFAPPTTHSPLAHDMHLSPTREQGQLSPQTSPHSAHKLPATGHTLPSLSSQLLSPPTGHTSSFAPIHSPTHLPSLLSHQTSMDTRHLPPSQSFLPRAEHVWPARAAPPLTERGYETPGERSYERGYESGGTREYHISGDRGGGGYTRSTYIPPDDRHTYPERAYVSREERTHESSARYEREPERKSRKPEMLPFTLPHDQRPTRREAYQGSSSGVSYGPPSSLAQYQTSPSHTSFQTTPSYSSQVFAPTNPYSASSSSLFTTRELIPGQSRLPVLGERTPSPRRKREGRTGGSRKAKSGNRATSSQEMSEVPDSTAGSSDGGH
ncbi:hypothetical protein FRC10_004153 [Ceratobasidium sp. 414]|nr:hypothetical protein FRC10_004153 [Ceratobasidium sp. 414]